MRVCHQSREWVRYCHQQGQKVPCLWRRGELESWSRDRQGTGDGYNGEGRIQRGMLECGHLIVWHDRRHTPPNDRGQKHKHRTMHQRAEYQGVDHHKKHHKRKECGCEGNSGVVEGEGKEHKEVGKVE